MKKRSYERRLIKPANEIVSGAILADKPGTLQRSAGYRLLREGLPVSGVARIAFVSPLDALATLRLQVGEADWG